MLSELAEAADRFRREGRLPPPAYRPKSVNWIVQFDAGGSADLLGRFKRGEQRQVSAPIRYRSGQIGPDNLKPYLLLDDARYTLGIPEPRKEREAALAHRSFVELVEEAYGSTSDADLGQIVEFLRQPLPSEIRKRIGARDVVTFRCEAIFPCEKEAAQLFWVDYLARQLAGGEGTCAVCGRSGPTLRILPEPVRIIDQDCQITSFNRTAFESFGKKQMANAPLCYECVTSLTQALKYLVDSEHHRAVLARDNSRGEGRNPLRNQLAVFWLKEKETRFLAEEGIELDIERLLGAPLAPGEDDQGPAPELAQLEELLRVPWTARESATHVSRNSFHLAVLSPNKTRLVVREWIAVSLDPLWESLRGFLQALRIINPDGESVAGRPIPALLEAFKPEGSQAAAADANLVRHLLRTAYLGQPPADSLLTAVLNRFRVPDQPAKRAADRLRQARRRQALAAAVKLVLTYGKEEAKSMERLDTTRNVPAYLCGRLMVILEEIQQRASEGRLNTTLVDRFYGAASTAPATTFGTLIRQAQTAHLPKIRKDSRGYGRMQELLEEVLDRLDDAEGFPVTLAPTGQAEFALGFYHQRAAFRSERAQRRANWPATSSEALDQAQESKEAEI